METIRVLTGIVLLGALAFSVVVVVVDAPRETAPVAVEASSSSGFVQARPAERLLEVLET